MASSGSGSGSQSSVAGTAATNNTSGDDAEAQNGTVNAKYPLWAHASKVSSDETGRGGNARFLCHFCNKSYPGSYSRVRAHLLQIKRSGVGLCDKLPNHIFVQLCKDDKEASVLILNGPTRKTIPLPTFDGSGSSRKRKATGKQQQGIEESFNMETKQQADALIGRMFYTGGVPFNLARNHGGSTKLLKKLALKLLGQPASSSCCERNWSTYAFIHSSARNKLNPLRAADLVFTHNNHRLLSRHTHEYESGPSKMWDVGGDGVESFTGVGMLEGADLSLDEPELEEQMMEDLS